jgi:hypothetical protein
MVHVSTVSKKMQFAASWEPVPPGIYSEIMIAYPGVRQCQGSEVKYSQEGRAGKKIEQVRRHDREGVVSVQADMRCAMCDAIGHNTDYTEL